MRACIALNWNQEIINRFRNFEYSQAFITQSYEKLNEFDSKVLLNASRLQLLLEPLIEPKKTNLKIAKIPKGTKVFPLDPENVMDMDEKTPKKDFIPLEEYHSLDR